MDFVFSISYYPEGTAKCLPQHPQGARLPLPYTEKNKVSVGNDWKSFIPKVTQKS